MSSNKYSVFTFLNWSLNIFKKFDCGEIHTTFSIVTTQVHGQQQAHALCSRSPELLESGSTQGPHIASGCCFNLHHTFFALFFCFFLFPCLRTVACSGDRISSVLDLAGRIPVEGRNVEVGAAGGFHRRPLSLQRATQLSRGREFGQRGQGGPKPCRFHSLGIHRQPAVSNTV